MALALFVVIAATLSGCSNAQKRITGTWSRADNEETIVFDGEGSYSRTTAVGVDEGKYTVLDDGSVELASGLDEASGGPPLVVKPNGRDSAIMYVKGLQARTGTSLRITKQSGDCQLVRGAEQSPDVELTLSREGGDSVTESQLATIRRVFRGRAAELGFAVSRVEPSTNRPGAFTVVLARLAKGESPRNTAIKVLGSEGRLLAGVPGPSVDPAALQGAKAQAELARSEALDVSAHLAAVEAVIDHQTGQHYLVLKLDESGKKEFSTLTASGIGKQVVVTIDGNVLAAPMINETVDIGEIPIPGESMTSAALKAVLHSGPLPFNLVFSEAKVIGP